jgi:hypothetical protein
MDIDQDCRLLIWKCVFEEREYTQDQPHNTTPGISADRLTHRQLSPLLICKVAYTEVKPIFDMAPTRLSISSNNGLQFRGGLARKAQTMIFPWDRPSSFTANGVLTSSIMADRLPNLQRLVLQDEDRNRPIEEWNHTFGFILVIIQEVVAAASPDGLKLSLHSTRTVEDAARQND